MFVPPWNRFHKDFTHDLQAIGYKAISTFTPRSKTWAAQGLMQVNTHVDPIDWHGTRSVADPVMILEHTVATLRDRRQGVTDASEPLGFLTHHLVHDPAIWDFCATFLERFTKGPVRIWTAAELNE